MVDKTKASAVSRIDSPNEPRVTAFVWGLSVTRKKQRARPRVRRLVGLPLMMLRNRRGSVRAPFGVSALPWSVGLMRGCHLDFTTHRHELRPLLLETSRLPSETFQVIHDKQRGISESERSTLPSSPPPPLATSLVTQHAGAVAPRRISIGREMVSQGLRQPRLALRRGIEVWGFSVALAVARPAAISALSCLMLASMACLMSLSHCACVAVLQRRHGWTPMQRVGQ